jgi:hypothetical protein
VNLVCEEVWPQRSLLCVLFPSPTFLQPFSEQNPCQPVLLRQKDLTLILVLQVRREKVEVLEDVRCGARGSISFDATLVIRERARQEAAYLQNLVSCYEQMKITSVGFCGRGLGSGTSPLARVSRALPRWGPI